jgi:hypothetical protein
MIKILPGNIESANGVNPKGLNPKGVNPPGASAVKETDKQKEFVTELEHLLGTVRQDQRTSPKPLSQDRFSNRATYLKSQRDRKGLADTLFPKIMNGQRTIHYLRMLNKMKRLHGKGVKSFDSKMRKKVKISYLKRRSTFRLQHSAKGKKPYLKLLKHLDNANEVQHKNQKIGDKDRGTLGLENNGKRNGRIIKSKKRLILYKKQNEPLNVEQKGVTRISAESNKTGGAKDLTLVCTRYDNNIPRVETGPHLQALNYTNRKGDDIFSEIVKQFTLMVNKGGGEAKIVLEPQALGNIKLNIKLHNSEVNTHIVVDNLTLKDMIQSKLNVLQDSLLSQGFTLGSFSVEVKEKNTSPQMTGDRKNAGAGVKQTDEGIETDLQVPRMAELPWISTVVNITV